MSASPTSRVVLPAAPLRRFRRFFAVAGPTLAVAAFAHARPIMTEDTSTVGRHAFEASVASSYRTDDFSSPRVKYRTITLPTDIRIGLNDRLDVGLQLEHISQRLDVDSERYRGSRNGLLSPFLKWSPASGFGLLAYWHAANAPQSKQALPIARGNDFEFLALYDRLVGRFLVYANAGYLFRDSYNSDLGVSGGDRRVIRPGNVFEARLAGECPVGAGFSLLNEWDYFRFGAQTIGGVQTPDSAGEAADALVGVTWSRAGWNAGAGVAFGLLQERYTSFSLERGAGDVSYKFRISYRLRPRKPS